MARSVNGSSGACVTMGFNLPFDRFINAWGNHAQFLASIRHFAMLEFLFRIATAGDAASDATPESVDN